MASDGTEVAYQRESGRDARGARAPKLAPGGTPRGGRKHGARALRALQALTDTALSHLSLDALLPEMLERVRAVMGVDNVAILLLDEEAGELEVSAARGPEEEVVGRVRIPVGVGFAGRIAETRAPLAVADLTEYPVSNPLLRERLRSLLGVPLLAGDRVLGVVHIGTMTPREFTADEAALLELAADRIARAVERARLFEAAEAARRAAERHIAFLATTLEALGDGLVVVDAEGRILYGNPALSELLGGDTPNGAPSGAPNGRGGATAPDGVGGGEPPERVAEWARALEVRDARGEPLASDERALSRALRGETLAGPNALDVRFRGLDGRETYASVTGAPVRDGAGKVIGAVVAARDVTARRQVERRTRDALDAFIAITGALVEGSDEDETSVVNGDGAGDETSADGFAGEAGEEAGRRGRNALARRLAELTRGVLGCARVSISAVESGDEEGGALRARPVTIVGLSADKERQWWAEQETGQPRAVGEGLLAEDRARLLAGETITLDLTRPPYYVPNDFDATSILATAMRTHGRLVGILALDFLDASGRPHVFTAEEEQVAAAVARLGAVVLERGRLLSERREARAAALASAEATRRMDEFLGIAGHELRTPLTGIKASIQMAGRQVRGLGQIAGVAAMEGARAEGARAEDARSRVEHVEQLLERADRQTARLDRLVADLLDVSRIQAGKLEMRLETCDLAVIVRDVVREQRLNAPGRRIESEGLGGPVPVMADADRVGQVLTNYLTNAVKYSEVDRPIVVALRTGEAVARVEVRDQGPGVAREQQRRLFERFYRVPGVAVVGGSGVGLGLGLSISKTIVEQHGGRVGVESAPGAGSTFWFTLPLAQGDSGRAAIAGREDG